MSLCVHDSVMPVILGSISTLMMSKSLILFIVLLAFKHTHLSSLFLMLLDIVLVDLSILFS